MFSKSSPHGPSAARAIPPIVSLTLAMLGALAIFTPMWLNLLSQLGSAQSWYALRLAALGGTAGIVTLLVLSFKLSTFLFKHLGRVDLTRKAHLQPSERETPTASAGRAYVEAHASRSWAAVGSHR